MRNALTLLVIPLVLLTLVACFPSKKPEILTEIVEAKVVTLTTPTNLTVETTPLFDKKIYKVTSINEGIIVRVNQKVHVEITTEDGKVTTVVIIGVIG